MLNGFFVTTSYFSNKTLFSFFNTFHIGKHKLCLNRLSIFHRINSVIHMGYVVIFKASQNMSYGINFSNICQELITQTFTFRCALYKASNIYKRHSGGDNLTRLSNLRQRIETAVWNRNFTHIRLYGAKWKISGLSSCCLCKCIK